MIVTELCRCFLPPWWLTDCCRSSPLLAANGDEPAGVGAAGAAGIRWTQQARTQARAADQSTPPAKGRLQPRRAHEGQGALSTTLPRQDALSLGAGTARPPPPRHSRDGGRGWGRSARRPDAAGVREPRRRPFSCRVAPPVAARPREAWAAGPDASPVGRRRSRRLNAPGAPGRQAAAAAVLRHVGWAHQAD